MYFLSHVIITYCSLLLNLAAQGIYSSVTVLENILCARCCLNFTTLLGHYCVKLWLLASGRQNRCSPKNNVTYGPRGPGNRSKVLFIIFKQAVQVMNTTNTV